MWKRITLFVLVVSLSLFSVVSAQTPVLGPRTGATLTLYDPFQCTGTAPCFLQILQGLIGRVLLIVYPILAGMIFYGGLQMMLARGSSEKYKAGLKTIQYAVIGFVVIILSQGAGLIIQSILAIR